MKNLANESSTFPYQLHSAVLELTLRCDLNCIHCGGTAGRARDNELTLQEIQTLSKDLKRLGCSQVHIIGGEPFVRDDWLDLTIAIKQAGLDVVYITNGFKIADDDILADKIALMKPLTVGISLDGGTQTVHDKIRNRSGSFDRVLQSIEALQKRRINICVITTVNRLNVNELPKIRDLLSNKRVVWQIQVSNKNGRRFNPKWFVTQEEYIFVANFIKECRETYKPNEFMIVAGHSIGYSGTNCADIMLRNHGWKGCQAGISSVGIRSNGDIVGCDALPDQYIEGNIRQKSLFDIWTDLNAFSYNRKFEVSMLKGFCKKCPHGNVCRAGCSHFAYATSNNILEHCYCLYKYENANKNQTM